MSDEREKFRQGLRAGLEPLAKAIMDHFTASIGAFHDQLTAFERKLDAHIADTTVHRRPSRARRS